MDPHQISKVIALLLVASTVPKLAAASSLDDALAARRRGDYALALELLRPSADRGDPSAQFEIGMTYAVSSIINHLPQEDVEALKWIRKAAEQGNADAAWALGSRYLNGSGVLQDYSEAVKWLRRGADQGNAGAQNQLGSAYEFGRGVPQDYIQAHKWYNLAASQNVEVTSKLATESRNGVETKMSAAQVAEAQRAAREWKPLGR